MDPVSISLAVGLISNYVPKLTDKLFGTLKTQSKDTLLLNVYAKKGPKSGSIGTAYVEATAFSEYPVSFKLRVSVDSDRINSLEGKREPIVFTKEIHHLPEDREAREFKFANPLPNFFGDPLKEPVTVEILSDDDDVLETLEFTLEYID